MDLEVNDRMSGKRIKLEMFQSTNLGGAKSLSVTEPEKKNPKISTKKSKSSKRLIKYLGSKAIDMTGYFKKIRGKSQGS